MGTFKIFLQFPLALPKQLKWKAVLYHQDSDLKDEMGDLDIYGFPRKYIQNTHFVSSLEILCVRRCVPKVWAGVWVGVGLGDKV